MSILARGRILVIAMCTLAVIFFSACAAPMASEASLESPAMPATDMGASSDAGAEEAVFEEMEDERAPSDATAQRKIIGTANIDLVVDDTDGAVADITEMVTRGGGYVADANFYRTSFGDATALQGNMTLRVPAAALDVMLDQLAALAVDVTSQSLTRDDVTDQYTDLDARLRNLQATEAELLELLSEVRAKPNAKPEDILAVHRNVMEIRGQIEQAQGRQAMLDNLVSLSTIHLSLRPDTSALPIVEETWQPASTVTDALRALVASMQALGNAAIWLTLYALPIFLMLFLPVALFFWIMFVMIRRIRRRSKEA